jgi:hypothetical protein
MSCFRLEHLLNLVMADDFNFRSLLEDWILVPYWAWGRITRPQALILMSHETNHDPNMVAYFVYHGIFMMNVGSVRCACNCDPHFFSEGSIHHDDIREYLRKKWFSRVDLDF